MRGIRLEVLVKNAMMCVGLVPHHHWHVFNVSRPWAKRILRSRMNYEHVNTVRADRTDYLLWGPACHAYLIYIRKVGED